MIKNLILIAVIYLVYRFVKTIMLKGTDLSGAKRPGSQSGDDDVMIKCPQCEVYFPGREGVGKIHKGQTLYFCSEECKNKYK